MGIFQTLVVLVCSSHRFLICYHLVVHHDTLNACCTCLFLTLSLYLLYLEAHYHLSMHVFVSCLLEPQSYPYRTDISHCTTLHQLHHITHHITSQYNTFTVIFALHVIALDCIEPYFMSLHYITLDYITFALHTYIHTNDYMLICIDI